MKFIVYAFIYLTISASSVFGNTAIQKTANNTFYSRSEYLSLFPEESKNLDFFKELVKAPGVPLNSVKLVNIAYVSDGLQKSDYWRRSVLSLRGRLDELGVRYKIKEYFYKVDDYRKSVTSISRALGDKPDYLIYSYDKTRKDIVEKILKTSDVKVILQNMTTPIRAWSKHRPFMYVGFDHSDGAKLLADYYIRKTGGKGSYSLFMFKEGYINNMRAGTFARYIKNKSDIILNDSFFTKGSFKKSILSAKDYSKQKSAKVDKFIYASSTDIALGLSSILKKSKFKDTLINGWGGGEAELAAILKGELDVTVMRVNDDNGAAMAEAIKYDILGYSKSIPHVYYGDYVLIEKGIKKDVLEGYVNRAFRYSGVPNE